MFLQGENILKQYRHNGGLINALDKVSLLLTRAISSQLPVHPDQGKALYYFRFSGLSGFPQERLYSMARGLMTFPTAI